VLVETDVTRCTTPAARQIGVDVPHADAGRVEHVLRAHDVVVLALDSRIGQ
jgi:hypothetical protein